MMRRTGILILGLLLLLGYACGPKPEPAPTAPESTRGEAAAPQPAGPDLSAQEPIKVGALFAVTGPASNLGEPERNTALLIEQQINDAGGINGRPLQVIVEDTEGDEKVTVTKINKLIKFDNVCAIIGPSRSGTSMAVKPIAEENQIPLLSCAAAIEIVQPLSKWVFKTPQSDSDCVVRIYEHMKAAGIAKIAVMGESTGFGQSGRNQLKKLAPDYGITIVSDESYNPTDTDMTAQLTRIRGTDAQAVVNWSIVPAQSIIPKNMKPLGMTIPLYQSHGFGNIRYAQAAGEAADGLIFPAGALLIAESLPDSHPRKALLLQYKKDYETEFGESASTFGGHAYDALHLVVNAIKEVGPDRAKIRDFIENTKGFQGTAGTFNFSPEDHCGLTKEAFELITVKGGKFVPLQP